MKKENIQYYKDKLKYLFYKNTTGINKKSKTSMQSLLLQLRVKKLFPEKITISLKGYSREEVSLQYRIFNKTEDLLKYWEEILDITFKKEYELWYKFKEESETLNNKIICLINLS